MWGDLHGAKPRKTQKIRTRWHAWKWDFRRFRKPHFVHFRFAKKMWFWALLGILSGFGGNPTFCADDCSCSLGSVARTDFHKSSLTLQPLLFFGEKKGKENLEKCKGFFFAETLKSFEKKGKRPQKAREIGNKKSKFFAETLKSLEKEGKCPKKAREIGKRKKQGNRKKQGLEGQGWTRKVFPGNLCGHPERCGIPDAENSRKTAEDGQPTSVT